MRSHALKTLALGLVSLSLSLSLSAAGQLNLQNGADIDMTARIAEAGRLLGITVHDHIIIARDGHASMKGLQLI